MSGNFVANCLSGSSAMQGLWLQWKFVAMEMHSVFPVCRCPFLSGLSVTPKTQLPESRMGDFCFQLLSTDHLIAKTQFAEFNPVKNLPVMSNEMF